MDRSEHNFEVVSKEAWIESKVKNQVTFDDLYSVYILMTEGQLMSFNRFKTQLTEFFKVPPIRDQVVAHTIMFLDDYHQIVELSHNNQVIGVW